jgi:Tfp pilus assembly protein FimT
LRITKGEKQVQLKKMAKRKRRRGSQHGLSVLELLIVFAAIAVVVLIAVPGSDMLLEKYRLKAAYSELFNGLELAKSEAHARASTVIMCPSSNGHSCRTDHNWNHGWLVFTDGNGNGTAQDIELIQAFEAPNQKIRIVASGAVEAAASFTMTGLVEQNGMQTGLFRICLQDSGAPPRVVNVDEEGWIQPVLVHEEVCDRS